jgi:hypothetical protein
MLDSLSQKRIEAATHSKAIYPKELFRRAIFDHSIFDFALLGQILCAFDRINEFLHSEKSS